MTEKKLRAVPAFDVLDENILKILDTGEGNGISTYCIWQTLKQNSGYYSLSWSTIKTRLLRLECLGFVKHNDIQLDPGRKITEWILRRDKGSVG